MAERQLNLPLRIGETKERLTGLPPKDAGMTMGKKRGVFRRTYLYVNAPKLNPLNGLNDLNLLFNDRLPMPGKSAI